MLQNVETGIKLLVTSHHITWRRRTQASVATGKMRMCGSADFGTGSGENYGLRLRLEVV